MANVRQTADGKWRIDSCMNGHRRTFIGSNRSKVEAAERKWRNDIESFGKEIKKSKLKFSNVMLEHLLANIKNSVSLGTFERYMSIYNTHFKDSSFGKLKIQDIKQLDAQNFINSKKRLSKKSIELIYALMCNTFKHAIANDIVRSNIMESVSMPNSSKEKKEIEVMTIEEQKAYLQAAEKSYYYMLFLTALSTGMRVGEITALKWKDVDLVKNEIHVVSSARLVMKYDDDGNMLENELVTGNTKTKSSKRVIPISAQFAHELKKYRLETSGKDKGFVFKNTKGEQIKYDSIAKAHKLVCQKAGIRIVTFHCLRHTFATRSVELGVDYETLSQILGHSKPSITLNLYVHSTDDVKRQAIEKIGKLISTL